jgi:hypothetical protein
MSHYRITFSAKQHLSGLGEFATRREAHEFLVEMWAGIQHAIATGEAEPDENNPCPLEVYLERFTIIKK